MDKLVLEIERKDKSYFVINEELELYGEGDTLIDALKDFIEILEIDIEFFTKGDWKEYDEGAKEIKRIYHSFLENK